MPTIIRNRGIGETPTNNMCATVTAKLANQHAHRIIENRYPAEYGIAPRLLGRSFDHSLTTGIAEATQRIDENPPGIILIGYSAGAAVAGHTAAQLTPAQRRKVAAVILIADPFQPEGISGAGYGIAGSRRINGITARWIFDTKDPICCTPRNSPLRTIADQTSAMSLGDPNAWGTNLLLRLHTKQWQPIQLGRNPFRQYGEAIAAARRYASGDHTSYNNRIIPGSNTTYTQYAAQLITQYT